MNLKLKILILFVCSLIITMVPASAVETSNQIAQNTDNIKLNQANLADDSKEFAESTDTIDYHAKIIQDTVDEMNNVKWYQFWKWDFYLRKGPNKINSEGIIIESISQNINNIGSNAEQNADQITNDGEKNIQLALASTNQNNDKYTRNIPYNTGDAKENAHSIADNLSSRFKTKYTVTNWGHLKNGDIVQYPLSHNNYVYLQFVGMSPEGDKALFKGDMDTAVRLPVSELDNIQYRITSSNSKTGSYDSSPDNKQTFTPTTNFTNVHYIGNIQKNALANYNNSKVIDYNNMIQGLQKTKRHRT